MFQKIFLSLIVISLVTMTSFAQMYGKMKATQKMEELKKIKLIEILQMNEEASLKFFSRRSEHMKKIEGFNEAGKSKIDQIDELLKDKNEPMLKKAIDEYLQIQESIIKERQNFFKSVSDILTTEQMGKLVVFEERFRSELSGLLFKERNKRLRD